MGFGRICTWPRRRLGLRGTAVLGQQRRSLSRLAAAAWPIRRAELRISRVVALGRFRDCIAAQAMPLRLGIRALLACKVELWLLGFCSPDSMRLQTYPCSLQCLVYRVTQHQEKTAKEEH